MDLWFRSCVPGCLRRGVSTDFSGEKRHRLGSAAPDGLRGSIPRSSLLLLFATLLLFLSGCDLVVEYKDGPDPGGDGLYLIDEAVLFYGNCIEEGLLYKPKPEYLSWEVDGEIFHHDGDGTIYVTGLGGSFELAIVDAGDEGEFLFATFHDIGPHVVRMICDNGNDDTEDDEDLEVPLEVVVCLDDSHCDDSNAYTGEETCSADHECQPGVPSCDEGITQYCEGLDHPDCPGTWVCMSQECYWDCEGPDPCEAAADCVGSAPDSCPGAWSCVDGDCSWACDMDYCEAHSDCNGPAQEDCSGFWSCSNNTCQWKCIETMGTCIVASDCEIQPLAVPMCLEGFWQCPQGVCQYQCIVPDDDIDLDGIPAASDPCPFDPYDDSDGDGLCGDVDNCPFVANESQGDENGNGIGDECDWEEAFEVNILPDSPPGQIKLQIKLHRYEIVEVEQDGDTYLRVEIDGLRPTCNNGEPALPSDGVVLQVPLATDSVSILEPASGGGPIRNKVSEFIQGTPIPCDVRIDGNRIRRYEDPQIYERTAIPYPLSPVRLWQPITYHHRGLANLVFYPVIFHPDPDSDEHVIEILTEFELLIHIGEFTPNEPDDPYYLPKDVFDQLSHSVENFELLPGEQVVDAARVLVVGHPDMLQAFSEEYLEQEHKSACLPGYTVINDPESPGDDEICEAGVTDEDGLTWNSLDITTIDPDLLKSEIKSRYNNHIDTQNPLRHVLILGSDEFVPLAVPERLGLFGTEWDRFVWVEVAGEYSFDADYPYIIMDYNSQATGDRKVHLQFTHRRPDEGPENVDPLNPCSAYDKELVEEGLQEPICEDEEDLPAGVDCCTTSLSTSKTSFYRPLNMAKLMASPFDLLNLTFLELADKYLDEQHVMYPASIWAILGNWQFHFGPTWDKAVTCKGTSGCSETGDWIPFTIRFYVGAPTDGGGYIGLKTAMAHSTTIQADSFSDAAIAPRHFSSQNVRYDSDSEEVRVRIWRAPPSDPENNDIESFPFSTCVQADGCIEKYIGWNDMHQVEYLVETDGGFLNTETRTQQETSSFACYQNGEYYGHEWFGEELLSGIYLFGGGEQITTPVNFLYKGIHGDYYYQYHDLDGSGAFNLYPQVHIGRIPASDLSDLSRALSRQTAFETSVDPEPFRNSIVASRQYHSGMQGYTFIENGVQKVYGHSDLSNPIRTNTLTALHEEEILSPDEAFTFLSDTEEIEYAEGIAEQIYKGVLFGASFGHGTAGMDEDFRLALKQLGVPFPPLWFWSGCSTNMLQRRGKTAATLFLFLDDNEGNPAGPVGLLGSSVYSYGSYPNFAETIWEATTTAQATTAGQLVDQIKDEGSNHYAPCDSHIRDLFSFSYMGFPTTDLTRLKDWDGDGRKNLPADMNQMPLVGQPDLAAFGTWDRCPHVASSGYELPHANSDLVSIDEELFDDFRGDECDNCTGVYNPFQEDWNGDGVGDLCDDQQDWNGDGIVGPDDAVPNHRNYHLKGVTLLNIPPVNPLVLQIPPIEGGIHARVWAHIVTVSEGAEPGGDDVEIWLETVYNTNIDPIPLGTASMPVLSERRFFLPAGENYSFQVRIEGPDGAEVVFLDLALIDERAPYQLGYLSSGDALGEGEDWSFSSEIGQGAKRSFLGLHDAAPAPNAPAWCADSRIDGYAAFVSENVNHVYDSTTVTCGASLHHTAMVEGTYQITFDYETLFNQPVEGLHLIRVCDLDPPYSFLTQEDSARGARRGLAVVEIPPGKEGCRIQFCQRGAGRYVVDNVRIEYVPPSSP